MKKSLLLLAFTALLCNLSAQLPDSSQILPPQWWGFPLEKSKPQYKITNTKLIGWSVCIWAGLVDGVLEGYGFDGRRSFERKFGADPDGYFGSRSWAKAYPDKNPQNPIKPASKVSEHGIFITMRTKCESSVTYPAGWLSVLAGRNQIKNGGIMP